MAAIDGLPPLRDVIQRHGLDAKKSLGQNFLFDLNLTQKIARTAGPLDGVTVIEVGPGHGGLTRAILSLGAKRLSPLSGTAAACRHLRRSKRIIPDVLRSSRVMR